MIRPQLARLILIVSAVFAGVWFPLRLLQKAPETWQDWVVEAVMSLAALLSIGLRLRASEREGRALKHLLSLGALVDLVCLLPLNALGLNDWSDLLMIRQIFWIKSFLDEFPSLQPVVYRLVPLLLSMPLLVHGVACGWIALGSGTAGPDLDPWMEYIRAVYWSFTTLTTVGYGDISAKTAPQMLFASGTQVIGVGVFGFVLSNVASLISRLDAAREHHMDNVERMENFMRSNSIPASLKAGVRHYYHYLWKNHRGYRDQSLLDELPGKLQSELSFYINRAIIERVSLFQEASQDLIEDLMSELKSQIFAPGEKIFRVGEPGTALYFVHSGSVEILGPTNELIASLGDGACFGEMALVSDRPRNASARAVTFCNLYVLSKQSFERVIGAYPDFKTQIEALAQNRQPTR